MATFSFTGRLQLSGPSNINQIVSQINQQLRGVTAQVNVSINPQSLSSISALNNQLNSLNTNISALNSSLGNTAAQIGQVGTAAQSVNSAVSNLNRSVSSTTSFASQASKAIKEVENSVYSFGEQAGLATRRFLAFSLAAGAIVSLITSFRQGISEAISFEREMVRLNQVSNDSKASLRAVADEVGRLSTSYGVSSQDLIRAAVTIRQAGYSADDTRKALEGLAQAALSPNFDNIQKTTEGAIAILSQFKLKIDELQPALGSINAVAAEFAVEAKDIIEAVQRAGGAFSTLGGNLNEFIAVFTSVRATTRESAESISTGLRTIFARLQRRDTIEALNDLRINLRYTAQEAQQLGNLRLEGQFVGPYEAIQRLSQGLRDLPATSQRYADIVEQIGGYRQISRVLPLLQEVETRERALQTARGGGASLAESAEKAQESLLVRTKQVGEEFNKLFRTIVESDTFQSLARSLLTVAEAMAKVLEFAKPLLPLLVTVAGINLVKNVGLFTSGFINKLEDTKNSSYYNIRGYSSGGVVPGFGNMDSQPAMLQPGEFVIRKQAAEEIGYDRLQKLNYGGGGLVQYLEHGSREPIRVNEPFKVRSGIVHLRRSLEGHNDPKGASTTFTELSKLAKEETPTYFLRPKQGVLNFYQKEFNRVLSVINSRSRLDKNAEESFEGSFFEGYIKKLIGYDDNTPIRQSIYNQIRSGKEGAAADLFDFTERERFRLSKIFEIYSPKDNKVYPADLSDVRLLEIKRTLSGHALDDVRKQIPGIVKKADELGRPLFASGGLVPNVFDFDDTLFRTEAKRPNDFVNPYYIKGARPTLLSRFAARQSQLGIPTYLSTARSSLNEQEISELLEKYGINISGKHFAGDFRGKSVVGKKADYLQSLVDLYGSVNFFDDDYKNIQKAREIPGVIARLVRPKFADGTDNKISEEYIKEIIKQEPELLFEPPRSGAGFGDPIVAIRQALGLDLGSPISGAGFGNTSVRGYAGGGSVDSVPAMLTPGEFVLRKQAVDNIGVPNLVRMNKTGKTDHIQGFNNGGLVQYMAGGGILDRIFSFINPGIEKIQSADLQGASTSGFGSGASNIQKFYEKAVAENEKQLTPIQQQVRVQQLIAELLAKQARLIDVRNELDVLYNNYAIQRNVKGRQAISARINALEQEREVLGPATTLNRNKETGRITKVGDLSVGGPSGLESRLERFFGGELTDERRQVLNQRLQIAQYALPFISQALSPGTANEYIASGGNVEGYAVRSALSGGVTEASTYSAIGQSIGGIPGGLIGAAAGFIKGAITSIVSAGDEFEKARLSEHTRQFAQRLKDQTRIIEEGGDVNFDENNNERREFLRLAASRIGNASNDRGLFAGFTDIFKSRETINKEQEDARNRARSEIFNQQYIENTRTEFSNRLRVLARNQPGLTNEQLVNQVNRQNPDLPAFLGHANISRQEQLRIAQNITRSSQQNATQDILTIFRDYSVAIRNATESTKGFSDRIELVNASLSTQSSAVRIETPDLKNLLGTNRFSDVVNSYFNNDLGDNGAFRDSLLYLNNLQSTFTEALSSNRGISTGEGFSQAVRDILSSRGVSSDNILSTTLLTNVTNAFNNLSNSDSRNRDPSVRAREIIANSGFSEVIGDAQNAINAMNDRIKAVVHGLSELANINIKVVGIQQQLYNAQLQVIRTRAEFESRNTGRNQFEFYNISQANRGFEETLQNYLRPTGFISSDPTQIGREAIRNQNELINLQRSRESGTFTGTIEQYYIQLQTLQIRSNYFANALQHLTRATETATEARNRLNTLEQSREAQFGLLQRYYGGSPEQRGEITRDYELASQVASALRQGQNVGINDFSLTQQQRLVSFLSSNSNLRIEGRSGNEILRQLFLRDNPSLGPNEEITEYQRQILEAENRSVQALEQIRDLNVNGIRLIGAPEREIQETYNRSLQENTQALRDLTISLEIENNIGNTSTRQQGLERYLSERIGINRDDFGFGDILASVASGETPRTFSSIRAAYLQQLLNRVNAPDTTDNAREAIFDILRRLYANENGDLESVPGLFNRGGPVYANRGIFVPRGTDTVPAMLTPGEFVVNREATQRHLPLLRQINDGIGGYSKGGAVYLQYGGDISSYYYNRSYNYLQNRNRERQEFERNRYLYGSNYASYGEVDFNRVRQIRSDYGYNYGNRPGVALPRGLQTRDAAIYLSQETFNPRLREQRQREDEEFEQRIRNEEINVEINNGNFRNLTIREAGQVAGRRIQPEQPSTPEQRIRAIYERAAAEGRGVLAPQPEQPVRQPPPPPPPPETFVRDDAHWQRIAASRGQAYADRLRRQYAENARLLEERQAEGRSKGGLVQYLADGGFLNNLLDRLRPGAENLYENVLRPSVRGISRRLEEIGINVPDIFPPPIIAAPPPPAGPPRAEARPGPPAGVEPGQAKPDNQFEAIPGQIKIPEATKGASIQARSIYSAAYQGIGFLDAGLAGSALHYSFARDRNNAIRGLLGFSEFDDAARNEYQSLRQYTAAIRGREVEGFANNLNYQTTINNPLFQTQQGLDRVNQLRNRLREMRALLEVRRTPEIERRVREAELNLQEAQKDYSRRYDTTPRGTLGDYLRGTSNIIPVYGDVLNPFNRKREEEERDRRPRFATGGYVNGPDVVPAYLSAGEYIMSRGAVDRIGLGNLNYLQYGGLSTNRLSANGLSGNNIGSSGLSNTAPSLPDNTNLINALNSFVQNTNKLANALEKFPNTLTVTGNHKVEVIHNGIEVFRNMEESLQNMISSNVSEKINEIFKEHFPDINR